MKGSYIWSILLDVCILQTYFMVCDTRRDTRKHRKRETANNVEHIDPERIANSVDFIYASTTVAVGDTAVLHCSFDAIFSQLRNGNIDWVRESSTKKNLKYEKPQLIATGKKVVLKDKRFRVFRPHNSALSVLIIRRAKKRDAGIFRCNLSGSSTRHKYLILNVTESKIEAKTSPAKLKARMDQDVTLWCNATGYPKPVVYWTREDRNRKLSDGNYQFWGNGLTIEQAKESDTGIYACYLDNFVQPVVSYKFSLIVEDRPWNIDAFKMRFDSNQWFDRENADPKPVIGKSYLLMCETRGTPSPVPKIQWYKDGEEVTNSRQYYIIEDRPEWRESYASSTLVIMKFSPKNEGNYTCVAANVFRMKKKTFNVKGLILRADSGGSDTTPKGEIKTADDLDEYDDISREVEETNIGPEVGDDEDYAGESGSGHKENGQRNAINLSNSVP